MTSSSHYADAHTWRMRAEEVHAQANELKEAEPRAIMLNHLVLSSSVAKMVADRQRRFS